MRKRKAILYWMVLFTLFILSYSIEAHKPIDTSGIATRDNPIVVQDHCVSWAAYNELEEAGTVHFYKLADVQIGEKIYLDLLIPDIQRLQDFYPVLALIGPNMERDWGGLEEELLSMLEIEENEGIIVQPYVHKNGETFFEPFTQTRYLKRQVLEHYAEADGDYFVAVFDVEGRADKYVMSIGRVEQWGLKDIVQLPRIWWDVRIFMEREQSTYIVVGSAVSLLVFLGIYLFIR